MEDFLRFISLQDPNLRMVVMGTLLYAASSSCVGVFAFLRKRSLIGDAVAHAVLPGVCLAFLVVQTKSLLVLLLGASIAGWLAIVSIDLISNKSKLKSDTAIGIVLSVFFGLGMMLLTHIQSKGLGAQSGLDSFLFGSAAAITMDDVYAFLAIAVILFASVLLFYKEFKLLCFDRDYAQVIGVPIRLVEWVLSVLTVLAIAVGIQAVGVVLMAAMLITPALVARLWVHRMGSLIALAVSFAMLSGLGGTYVSYIAPAMPTGPWIIVMMAVLMLISLLLSPQKGWLSVFLRQRKNQNKIAAENLLKCFYHAAERKGELQAARAEAELREMRSMSDAAFKKGVKQLLNLGYITASGQHWSLTDTGAKAAARIVRLHRLWELYLTQHLNIAQDHVHQDAEAIEHVLTPELEALLEKELDYPEHDPHGQKIQY